MNHRFTLAIAAATLVACAGGESGTADSAAAPAAASVPNVVTVTARDFAFSAPDTIPAGMTTIRLMVEGTGLHHAQLLKFDDGKTLADFTAAIQAMKPGDAPPTWVHEVGGPNPPPMGGESNSTQMLEPGNYAVVCFVDIPDKVPHIMKGMAKAFVVVPSSVAAAEPTADVTMDLVDYNFSLSAPLSGGSHTIKVNNTAQQAHEVAILRFEPGKTMEDLGKWAATFQGPPPISPVGGVAAIKPASSAYFTVTLTPGDYVLICFVPDAKDGKPHVEHGMAQPFKIS
jgi:uncharacterized cupredoxin-like copper-binding protein